MTVWNLVPWSISLVSLIIVILTYIRTGRKDRASEIKEDDLKINGIRESLLKANLKLDQVCTTTTETRTDIKSLNRDLKDMDTRVVILERDMKTAFSIIDELKEKVDAS